MKKRNDCREPTQPVRWVEGSSTVENLLENLSNVITEGTTWEEEHLHLRQTFVEYERNLRTGVTVHYTDELGHEYPVYRLNEAPDNINVENGVVYEIMSNTPGTSGKIDVKWRTGVRIDTKGVRVRGRFIPREDVKLILKDKHPELPDNYNMPLLERYEAVQLRHAREDYEGNIVEDEEWDSFEEVGPLDDQDYVYAMKGGIRYGYEWIPPYPNGGGGGYYSSRSYSLNHRRQDLWNITGKRRVVSGGLRLICNPKNGEKYSVSFNQPYYSNNYIEVKYDSDLVDSERMQNRPDSTYKNIIRGDIYDYDEGDTVTIVDKNAAYKAYERQLHNVFVPGTIKESGGSPISYWYFSSMPKEDWMGRRTGENVVEYQGHVSDERVVLRLKADPSFDSDTSYSSLAYIGKVIPLDPKFDKKSFVVTVGMGSGKDRETEILLKDIKPDKENDYGKYGSNTSNGMVSVSMIRNRAGLKYQAYYPSFLTELPNFPRTNMIPPGTVDYPSDRPGYVVSKNTGKIHASPIYLVNPYEGYTAIMEGIVAVNGDGLIEGDELFEVREYGEDVYVNSIINSPISFLDSSPAPGLTKTIAILKEVKEERIDNDG